MPEVHSFRSPEPESCGPRKQYEPLHHGSADAGYLWSQNVYCLLLKYNQAARLPPSHRIQRHRLQELRRQFALQ